MIPKLMFILPLLISHVVATATARQTPMLNLGPTQCTVYLEGGGSLDHDVRQRAKRVLRWISMRDPAFGRALEAADSVATQYNLLDLPLGFVIAPSGGDLFESSKLSEALKKIMKFEADSTGFGANFSANRKGFKQMRRDRDWIWQDYARSEDQNRRIKIISRVLTNVRDTLSWLISPAARITTANARYPRLVGYLNLGTIEGSLVRIRFDWAKSFTIEDLNTLSLVRADFEDARVVAVVIELLYRYLPSIVARHQDVGLEVTRTSSRLQVSNVWSGFRDFEFYLPYEDNAPSTSEFTPAPLPSPEPPAIILTDAAILKFVETPLILESASIEADVREAWLRMQHLAGLVNDTLARMHDLPAVNTAWAVCAERLRGQPSYAIELSGQLNQNVARVNSALAQLVAAEAALEKLHAWLDSARGTIQSLDEETLTALTPRAMDALQSTAKYSTSTSMLLHHAREALGARHHATSEVIAHFAAVKLLLGNVMSGELLRPSNSAESNEAREHLTTKLNQLAGPKE